jgi:signal transduction histidine kinase
MTYLPDIPTAGLAPHLVKDASVPTMLGSRIVSEGAHEVRSQLAVILLELGRLDHNAARRLETDVQTASDTVNRIATLFRLTTAASLDSSLFNVVELVRDVTQHATDAFPERRLTVEISGNHADVSGHRPFLAEALRGLLENANRHTPPGTPIIVRCRPGAIAIDDGGPGLPAVVAKRFAEPFVHGRGPQAGAGLGLAMAHQIARLHGGHCRQIASELGGTCICLTFNAPLPAAAPLDQRT